MRLRLYSAQLGLGFGLSLAKKSGSTFPGSITFFSNSAIENFSDFVLIYPFLNINVLFTIGASHFRI